MFRRPGALPGRRGLREGVSPVAAARLRTRVGPGTCVPWHGELAAGARGELGHRAEWACPRPLEWACIPAHVRGRLNDFTWESSSPRSRRPRMGGISTSHDWTDQDFMAVPGSAECRGSRQAQHWKVHFEGEKCRCTIFGVGALLRVCCHAVAPCLAVSTL